MIDLISDRVLEKLRQSGLDINDIDFQKILDMQVGTTMTPKVNISVDTGSFKQIAMRVHRANVVVSLILVATNLRGEKERKFKNYKLITGIIETLYLEKLGLDLQDPLTPVGFSNVTDERFNDAGYSLYQLDFVCSFNFEKSSVTGDRGYLESIVNNYFLDDTNESIESYVLLNQIYGGDAWSNEFVETISGGYAGTSEFIENITGGNAVSTYGA